MDALELNSVGGECYVVPARIDDLHTFIFLEQEQWFEKEVAFLRRWAQPGHVVADIAADVGPYTIPLASQIGPEGRVYAFESRPDRSHFLKAGIELNGLKNVVVSDRLLSSLSDDSCKVGWQARVSTLDDEILNQGIGRIDLIRLDAFGNEARIVVGGRRFFSEQSPLVMFKIKQGQETRDELRWTFRALGYGIYRLLGDGSYLVPLGDDEALDAYELSLFAQKPESDALLKSRGLLAGAHVTVAPIANSSTAAIEELLSLPYADAWGISRDDLDQSVTGQAMALYAVHRYSDQPADVRWASLETAYAGMLASRGTAPSLPWLMTFARIAHDEGHRVEAVAALTTAIDLIDQIKAGAPVEIAEPFLPPSVRYDSITPADDPVGWICAAVLEAYEQYRALSARFYPAPADFLESLCTLPFATGEMHRRLLLQSLLAGTNAVDMRFHINREAVHINPEHWSAEGYKSLLYALNEPGRQVGQESDTADAGENEPLRLHIGGCQSKEGWKILNVLPGPHVDFIGDVKDLSGFRNNSVEAIYASHVLEHLDQNALPKVLRELRRILRKSQGQLMISVPDIETLCKLFGREDLDSAARWHVMRMMFGGQVDPHDYHQIGLCFESLSKLLEEAGFNDVRRVEAFGIFDDTSSYAPYGESISLNVIAS